MRQKCGRYIVITKFQHQVETKIAIQKISLSTQSLLSVRGFAKGLTSRQSCIRRHLGPLELQYKGTHSHACLQLKRITRSSGKK
jgi:hypothetical protein